jgi:hypothetical protein
LYLKKKKKIMYSFLSWLLHPSAKAIINQKQCQKRMIKLQDLQNEIKNLKSI